MSLVQFTRPDGAPILIESEDVHTCAPVPPRDSPLGGPLDQGTRITFKSGEHQDVRERLDVVRARLAIGKDDEPQ